MLNVTKGTLNVLVYDWIVAIEDALDTPNIAKFPLDRCLHTETEKETIISDAHVFSPMFKEKHGDGEVSK